MAPPQNLQDGDFEKMVRDMRPFEKNLGCARLNIELYFFEFFSGKLSLKTQRTPHKITVADLGGTY